ncbi:MAG TPA: PAS domain S-box protein, partial [Kiloniellales bacterium]|nr:PAS domain S-box protein [Kiloniellales bacterium]
MSRGASLLGAIAALICLPTTALAQTPATPTPPAAPAAWLEGLILVGLAATALAIVAALIAMVRLRRQFALQRDILAAVPQPRQVVGADGRSILANPSFVEFFGESERPAPELLLEQAVGDEEAREQLARLAANARNGTAGYTEIRVRPRGGAPGARGGEESEEGAPPEWRYVAAYPVTGRPGMVFWVIDDITLRRQMEQVVQEEQERFVDLLENAPIGFYSVDAAGNFLFANHTLCDWLGLSYEDLDGSMIRLHDVVATELPEGTPGYDPFGTGDATRGEVALKGADDTEFQASISQDLVYDETGAVERTRSVVRHLSREREMVEALERSRERFERFFREAPVGLALLDSAGKLRECNQSLAELTGRPA